MKNCNVTTKSGKVLTAEILRTNKENTKYQVQYTDEAGQVKAFWTEFANVELTPEKAVAEKIKKAAKKEKAAPTEFALAVDNKIDPMMFKGWLKSNAVTNWQTKWNAESKQFIMYFTHEQDLEIAAQVLNALAYVNEYVDITAVQTDLQNGKLTAGLTYNIIMDIVRYRTNAEGKQEMLKASKHAHLYIENVAPETNAQGDDTMDMVLAKGGKKAEPKAEIKSEPKAEPKAAKPPKAAVTTDPKVTATLEQSLAEFLKENQTKTFKHKRSKEICVFAEGKVEGGYAIVNYKTASGKLYGAAIQFLSRYFEPVTETK